MNFLKIDVESLLQKNTQLSLEKIHNKLLYNFIINSIISPSEHLFSEFVGTSLKSDR